MKDAERKVKQLRRLIETAHAENYDFVYMPVGDAKTIVKLLSREEGFVRCEDCRYFQTWKDSEPLRGLCQLQQRLRRGEWFCADGQQREVET